MGLDVYLRRYEDYNDTRRREDEYARRSEEIYAEYGKYDTMTEDQKTEARERKKEIGASLGLDDWGTDEKLVQKIQLDSPTHPKHMFKVGYFRSSYNDGGINRVVDNLTGKDGLHWVFQPPRDEYSFRPDWVLARTRALELIEEMKVKLKADSGQLCAFFEAPNLFSSPAELKARCASAEDAIKIFREQVIKNGNRKSGALWSGNYSNHNGVFYLGEPLKLLAVVHGFGSLNQVGTYLIYKIEPDPADGEGNWYVNALEVVVETCDHVLKQPDVEKYRLSWSS